MNFPTRSTSKAAVMKRGALLGLLLASCARPIGVFTPNELRAAGRPREAWAGLAMDYEADPKLLALHEGALQHAAGAWAASEAAFTRAETAAEYPTLAAEAQAIARLRATNALALRGDTGPLLAVLPGFEVKPPAAGLGAVQLVFERSLAPRITAVYSKDGQSKTLVVQKDEHAAPARWQIDDAPSTAATLVDSLGNAWGAQLEARMRGGQTLGEQLGLDPFKKVKAAFRAIDQWWTPPTDWLQGRSELPPGKHVVTVTTLAGRRARVVEVYAGQTTWLVVPQ